MTAEEKALELIEKFKISDYDWIAQGNLYCVKQHALVAVQEILNLDDFSIEGREYWNKVKTELEALS